MAWTELSGPCGPYQAPDCACAFATFRRPKIPVMDICDSFFDGIMCWPKIGKGQTRSLACPPEIGHIPMDPNYNATRACLANGSWAEKANYSGCVPVPRELTAAFPHVHLEVMYVLYWVGYCLSLFFLLIALFIFIHYKQLHCLRNIIHTNLLLCFALHNFTWIMYSTIGHEFYEETKILYYCFIPTTILKYFITAGFFWMLVEGGFLFVTIMYSFHAQRINYWPCGLVGWGIPALLIVITGIIRVQKSSSYACWNDQFQLDYIFIGPILAILLVNLLFLIGIMYVIVSKLQMTIQAEKERYKKVCRALLILCPLLGINYVLVLVQPGEPQWLNLAFYYYITIMTSTQGTLVAVFFCFRNNEVMSIISKLLKGKRWPHRSERDRTWSFITTEVPQNRTQDRLVPGANRRAHKASSNVLVLEHGKFVPFQSMTPRSTSSCV